MSEDWRIAECRDQAILYVALRVVRELVPEAGLTTVPEPIHSDTALLLGKVDQMKKQPTYRGLINKLLGEIRRDYSAPGPMVAAIAKERPWKTKVVVQKWVELGSSIAIWKSLLESHQQQDLQRLHAAALDQSSHHPLRRITQCFRRRKTTSPTDIAVPQDLGIGATSELLDEVNKLMEHSTVWWCADNATYLDISAESFRRNPECFPDVANDRTDALRGLIDWCCEVWRRAPAPLKPMNGSISHYASAANDFVERAAIAYPPMVDKPLSSDAAVLKNLSQWRQPIAGHTPALSLLVLAKPLFLNENLYARGSLVSPPPAYFAKLILDSKPADVSLALAAERARKSWPENLTQFANIFASSDRPYNCTTFASECSSLVALVRLTTLVVKQSSSKLNTDQIALILKHDGNYEIDCNPISPDGESACDRLIPYTVSKSPAEPPHGDVSVTFTHKASLKLIVGVLGQPYHGAAKEVGTAVEDLDWRLWFMRTAMESSLVDKATKQVLKRAIDFFDPRAWELTKREWIARPDSPNSLQLILNDVHRVRVAMREILDPSRPDPLTQELYRDVKRCELAVLARLESDHRAAFERLFPPRLTNGRCNVSRWIDPDVCGDPRGQNFVFRWEPSENPFGTHLGERYIKDPNGRVQIRVSAGKPCSEDDLRILNAPFFVICPKNPAGTYFAPLHDFARRVYQANGAKVAGDLTHEIMNLRKFYHSESGQGLFNDLINASLKGDPNAAEWIYLFQSDTRFQWSCHPPISCDGKSARIQPATPEDMLSWQNDELIPAGEDVDIFFSPEKGTSRRVISRGAADPGSPGSLAQIVDQHFKEGPEQFRTFGTELLRATDLWMTFPLIAPHPLSAPGLASFLESMPQAPWDNQYDLQAAVIEVLAGWIAALGHRLLPSTWHPLHGAKASEAPGTDVVRFHPTVPAGNIVVERFGLDGEHAAAWVGHMSAGPAPAGFSVLSEATRNVSDDINLAREVKTCLADLPRHYLAGKSPLAGPALFNAVWNLVLEAPEAVTGSGRELTEAVAELLKALCGMTLFEPTGMGEYPSAWVRAPDGKSPRGDWIKRVVRPGVRTAKNTLVWPAVVETE